MNIDYQKHIYYMQRAIDLAELGRGRTSPNPMVGCVIVKGNRIIGEGYHEEAGKPHAEVNALNNLLESPEGSTIYINLEPCVHHGKTPPCVPKIIEAKPYEVVIAMQDPNPLVCGKGISALREAGIRVIVGILEETARKQNEVFLKYITTQKPFVIAKWAMTLDGKIATENRESKYITSGESLKLVHSLRSEVDCILVGGNTALIDNPYLTPKLVSKKSNKPTIRIILDKKTGLPENLNVFKYKELAETWIVTTVKGRKYSYAEKVIYLPPHKGKISLASLLEKLGEMQLTSILIEGGGETLASAFSEGVVDKTYTFVAPTIIGGKHSLTPVEGSGIAKNIAEGIKLRFEKVIPTGRDILIVAYPEYEEIRSKT